MGRNKVKKSMKDKLVFLLGFLLEDVKFADGQERLCICSQRWDIKGGK